ncbi:hypothetical protein ABIC76_001824 [Ralstonia sp. 1138]
MICLLDDGQGKRRDKATTATTATTAATPAHGRTPQV